MLRTGRPNFHSRRSSSGTNAESMSSDYLEDASMPRIALQSSRPQRSPFTRTTLYKTIGFVTLITAIAFVLTRTRGRSESNGKDEVQWSSRQGEPETNITAQHQLVKPSSAPIGKPLLISSLLHPPRVDRIKLSAQLAKLESEYPDDDVNNEDTDEVADDLRQAFGLSRWPPLISHVPSISNPHHEEYTVEVADMLFCSTVPCKVLVPAWVRPLSPTKQITQIQYLMRVAKQLNRTLVLPNTGHASNEAGETLLGIGTCHRHPFARYFDVFGLLSQTDKGNTTRLAVAMQPFLEWVKYRPVHPSAQVIVVDSSPSNDTDEAFFVVNGAEVRIDEQAEKGRGRHKNCLSSRASKLKFGDSAPFVISPQCHRNIGHSCETTHENNNSTYLEGLLTLLAGEIKSSDETICREGSQPCSSSIAPLEIGDPDVLVLEWALGSNHVASSLLNANKDGEDISLEYSPRLYALASRIISTLPRPLIVLHSQPASSIWTDSTPSANLSGVTKELGEYIGSFIQPSKAEDYEPGEKASGSDTELDISEFAETLEDASMDASVLSDSAQGTVWLDRGILLKQSASFVPEARSLHSPFANLEVLCRPSEQDSPGTSASLLNAFLSSDIFEDLLLTDVRSALLSFGLQTTNSYAELGGIGMLEDDATQAILGEIIERHADRTFFVGTGC